MTSHARFDKIDRNSGFHDILISFYHMVLCLATLQYQETHKLQKKLHLTYFHLVLNALQEVLMDRESGCPSANTWQVTCRSEHSSPYTPENFSIGSSRSSLQSGLCRSPSNVPLDIKNNYRYNTLNDIHENNTITEHHDYDHHYMIHLSFIKNSKNDL